MKRIDKMYAAFEMEIIRHQYTDIEDYLLKQYEDYLFHDAIGDTYFAFLLDGFCKIPYSHHLYGGTYADTHLMKLIDDEEKSELLKRISDYENAISEIKTMLDNTR